MASEPNHKAFESRRHRTAADTPPATNPQSAKAPLLVLTRNLANSSAGSLDSCILYSLLHRPYTPQLQWLRIRSAPKLGVLGDVQGYDISQQGTDLFAPCRACRFMRVIFLVHDTVDKSSIIYCLEYKLYISCYRLRVHLLSFVFYAPCRVSFH